MKAGKILIKDVIADAFLQQILTRPAEYSVIATMNLNGDYISDALAAIVSGIGIAPGANINYESGHAIFEATHGTAPKYAGLNKVNPGSVILSGVMMLEYIGWFDVAAGINASYIKTIEEKISEVDIISCATLSKTPLILGQYLQEGQHIDLLGAYKKDMREADDDTIKKSSVYVDTFQGGLKESGDIVIPIKNGILKEEGIKADLFQLCSNKKLGRKNDSEITVFKSVGHALEDLVAAKYYYTKFINE